MEGNQTDINLSGQVALVTGAGRGIGRSVAEALARCGGKVGLISRSADELSRVAASIEEGGGRALVLSGDVTERDFVQRAVHETESVLGPIDLLVNSAGIDLPGTFWEQDPDEWWRVVEVNLRGPMLTTSAVLPGMIARRGGRIIFLNSYASVRVRPENSAYACSKAALARLTDSLAAATTEHGIAMFGISPGWVRTSMTERDWQRTLAGEGSMNVEDWTPIEVPTQLALFLASGQADALTGRMIHVNDDVGEMVRRAQDIEAEGLYILRLPTLQGLVS